MDAEDTKLTFAADLAENVEYADRRAAGFRAAVDGRLTRLPAEPLRLDWLIRAGTIHSMTGQVYRCVGVQDGRIVGVSADPHGLDDLVGSTTATVDAAGLTVLPAFSDAYEQLLEASRNTLLVLVDRARSIAEFAAMVGAAARCGAGGVDRHLDGLA